MVAYLTNDRMNTLTFREGYQILSWTPKASWRGDLL